MMKRFVTLLFSAAILPSCMMLDTLADVAPPFMSSFTASKEKEAPLRVASNNHQQEVVLASATTEVSNSSVVESVQIPPEMPKGPALRGSASGLDAKTVDAARLLTQATFGPTDQSIKEVLKLGNEQWIESQTSIPSTHHVKYLHKYVGDNEREVYRPVRIEAWLDATIRGKDQLRQRVAFAYSQIFVISDQSDFTTDGLGITRYYDLLLDNAFENYRDLLERISLSPMMGQYLSMLGNEKPNKAKNIRPDENYAREIMQLFSIGLEELNLDGTPKLDANGKPIPTYDQSVIEGFAHVFTGWNYNGTNSRSWNQWDNYNNKKPMQALETYHDKGSKKVLRGQVIPAKQKARVDFQQALDNIFYHPNVGPFIGKQLIQRLVTSNPSKGYVARVAATFNDNGKGVRGDMKAVIKSILLDVEARKGHLMASTKFGKVREPLLKLTNLWRAFDVYSTDDTFDFVDIHHQLSQAPLSAKSVFNFYYPTYAPPGEITQLAMVAPELQITTENAVVRYNNFLSFHALNGYKGSGDGEFNYLKFDEERPLANNGKALMKRLDMLLFAGTLSEPVLNIFLKAHGKMGNLSADEKVAHLIYLIMNSPQYAVQK